MEEQLSKSDRDWIVKIEALQELTRHPGWEVYNKEVIEPVVIDLQDMLLGSKPFFKNEKIDPQSEMACIKALRLLLKVLIILRQRPESLMNVVNDLKREFPFARREGEEEIVEDA